MPLNEVSILPKWSFRCGRGHLLTMSFPLEITFGSGECKASTGPLCPVCLAADLRERYGVVEVQEGDI